MLKDIIIVTGINDLTADPKILKEKKLKVAWGWKNLIKELKKNNLTIEEPIFDLKIAGWLIDSSQKDFSLISLIQRFLKKTPTNPNDPQILAELYLNLNQKIKEYGLDFIFEKIETPLIHVLAAMEEWGIKTDKNELLLLKKEINDKIENLVKKIYHESGKVFNLNSPKQVADVLFKTLKIKSPQLKKTATGQRSTDKDILLELKDAHPIINHIIQYREDFKIKSGFVEPLLKAIKADGRVRTNFIQTGTTTGRLASENPNLQNIPQESEWSIPLRRAFKAEAGFSLLSFDYSQLELRLLAHLSGDEKLKTAFDNNLDIHKMTAAYLFNIPAAAVDTTMRRLAKTLNFGIIYGMSARTLALTGNLTYEKAQKFIEEYFQKFPKVKHWQKQIIEEVRTFGFVKNLNGRRRWFLEILNNPDRQGDKERAAINMPIQSLGADILKLAMIKIHTSISENSRFRKKVKLLLSIHDELLFEVADDILKTAGAFIQNTMQTIYPLSVPLEVEVKKGRNWGEMQRV